jgi:hypothetical protein
VIHAFDTPETLALILELIEWKNANFSILDGPEGNVLGSFIENCAEPTGNPPIPAVTIT